MRLRWTPIAVQHLESAQEYLIAERPEAADKLAQRILSTIELLQQHPYLGRTGRVSGTRELVFAGTPFIVAYRLHKDQIQILAVLHAARRWPETL